MSSNNFIKVVSEKRLPASTPVGATRNLERLTFSRAESEGGDTFIYNLFGMKAFTSKLDSTPSMTVRLAE
ncbi:unnamed protein product [Dovyalis caffra]|uniref:Uncharacterized protein n=1 Tax=Dovyalis caffra TaxID=77055 RepID=A0AAV1R225_9ROSI|nr:unnamed protein product [Dovyalis caffra]